MIAFCENYYLLFISGQCSAGAEQIFGLRVNIILKSIEAVVILAG